MPDCAQTAANTAAGESAVAFSSCPFCGSEARDPLVDVLIPTVPGADFHGVRCGACGATAPHDIWQRRIRSDNAVLLTIETLAARIFGNPCAHEIDKANASGILEVVRRLLDR